MPIVNRFHGLLSHQGTLILLSALFLFLLNSYALACSCSPEAYAPACQLISRSEAVFLGENLDLVPDPSGNGMIYRFRVERVYKGLDSTIREVLVNPGNGSSCQTEYSTKTKYLMFARVMSKGPLVVMAAMCSGSRSAERNKADIDFLENYVRGETVTEVYGKVLQWVTYIGIPTEDESAPLKGVMVVLENSINRFTFTTQQDGGFRFSGIPAGDYELTAKLDPYLSPPSPYKISVVQGGCKQVFVELKALSGIQGTLLTYDGKPAAKTRVELLRKHPSGKWYSTYKMWAQTDEQGIFHFKDIESGDYLLGYEIWGSGPSDYSLYPTLYFPGVPDRSAAEIIPLAPQQELKNLKLILPSPLTKRKITVSVIWEDGKPVGENLLQISSKQGFLRNLEGSQHGAVTIFEGYQEREYEFNARYWVDNLSGGGPVNKKRIALAVSVKLPPGKEDAEVKLVLSTVILRENEQ